MTPDLRAEALQPSSRAVCLTYEARLPIACRLPTNPRTRRRSSSPLIDGPPMRSGDPSAYQVTGSDQHRSYQLQLRSAYRLSQPLDALLHPKPFQPCFMLVTLMGFPPTEVFPPPVAGPASRPSLTTLPHDEPFPSCRSCDRSRRRPEGRHRPQPPAASRV
jgi:hypothetical protein